MSTIAIPLPAFESRICRCGASVHVGRGFPGQAECEPCRQFRATADAMRLLDDVQALAKGAAPFDALTPHERAEQLAQIFRPISQPAALKYPGFRKLSDQQLSDIIRQPFVMPGESAEQQIAEATIELARRLSAPTPEEREEIETRDMIEAMDPYDLVA